MNFQVDNCLNGYPSGYPQTYLDVNSTAIGTMVSVFSCPSERASLLNEGWYYSNYMANAGTGWTLTNANDGPFYITSHISLAMVCDGLSQTAAFSEYKMWPGLWQRPGNAPGDQGEFERWCNQASPPGGTYLPSEWGPDPWASTHWNTGYRHVLAPNHVTCMAFFDPVDWIYGVRSGAGDYLLNPPSSYHPGGVNAVFLDGSVRFVKDTIDRATWRALGTRSGQEVVSASDL